MSELVVTSNKVPAMSDASIAKVRTLETTLLAMPQVILETSHVIHAGVYARTVTIPAGVVMTGSLIKCATTLIISGHVVVYLDTGPKEIEGYHVLAASANRKVGFMALTDTSLTMLFSTKADNISQAEEEFTDEGHLLISRLDNAKNIITITGE